MIQRCPVCEREVKLNARYPRYVCSSCCKRATAPDRRKVEFFQSGALGLLAARYVETGEDYMGADCTIDGVECWAEEARFGGIVVQAA
jgi:hypothetical protein